MPNRDAQYVAGLAYRAGWRGINPASDLVKAIAVAQATGANDTSERGMWGIGGGGSGADQAAKAYDTWKAQGWAPFPGAQGQGWRLYVPGAVVAAANATALVPPVDQAVETGGDVADAVDQVQDVAAGVATSVNDLIAWLSHPQSWRRIAYVAVGAALVIGAAVVVVKSGAVNVVGSTVGKAIGTRK